MNLSILMVVALPTVLMISVAVASSTSVFQALKLWDGNSSLNTLLTVASQTSGLLAIPALERHVEMIGSLRIFCWENEIGMARRPSDDGQPDRSNDSKP